MVRSLGMTVIVCGFVTVDDVDVIELNHVWSEDIENGVRMERLRCSYWEFWRLDDGEYRCHDWFVHRKTDVLTRREGWWELPITNAKGKRFLIRARTYRETATYYDREVSDRNEYPHVRRRLIKGLR